MLINHAVYLDDSELSYPFEGANAKSKIALYQLKKSQLDFRLVIKSEQTETFSNTDIFCRSNELLEGKMLMLNQFKLFLMIRFLLEEGIEWKKSSVL